jgi:hypothetical protein
MLELGKKITRKEVPVKYFWCTLQLCSEVIHRGNFPGTSSITGHSKVDIRESK